MLSSLASRDTHVYKSLNISGACSVLPTFDKLIRVRRLQCFFYEFSDFDAVLALLSNLDRSIVESVDLVFERVGESETRGRDTFLERFWNLGWPVLLTLVLHGLGIPDATSQRFGTPERTPVLRAVSLSRLRHEYVDDDSTYERLISTLPPSLDQVHLGETVFSLQCIRALYRLLAEDAPSLRNLQVIAFSTSERGALARLTRLVDQVDLVKTAIELETLAEEKGIEMYPEDLPRAILKAIKHCQGKGHIYGIL